MRENVVYRKVMTSTIVRTHKNIEKCQFKIGFERE
jgi:hypothetical protein